MTAKRFDPRLEQEFWKLQAGDHLCWLCGSDAERDGVLARFIRQGIERHDKVLVVADVILERVRESMAESGLDAAALLRTGQIDFRGPDLVGAGKAFDPAAAIRMLAQAAERAAREGFHALRVTADMAGTQAGSAGFDLLIELEAGLDALLRSSRCLALCRWDRRRFDSAALLEVIAAHPKVVIDSEVFDNFYFIPPREIGGGSPADARLGSWLANLAERKRSETHIRMLTRRLMQTQEDERRMISRELHDRIGQDLSSIKIALETLPDRSGPEAAVRDEMEALCRILDRTIFTVRDLAYDLRPPGLDEMGLTQALSMFCSEFSEKTGIRTEFVSAGIEKAELDFTFKINLYRIVQEGLNNIHRHARAGLAVVKLTAAHPHIILRIEDNGVGFDVEQRAREIDSEKRMGLRSLKERSDLLGGNMIVRSKIGLGTKIFIKIPKAGWHHGRPQDGSDRR
jgi:signal transduction histidine kinase